MGQRIRDLDGNYVEVPTASEATQRISLLGPFRVNYDDRVWTGVDPDWFALPGAPVIPADRWARMRVVGVDTPQSGGDATHVTFTWGLELAESTISLYGKQYTLGEPLDTVADDLYTAKSVIVREAAQPVVSLLPNLDGNPIDEDLTAGAWDIWIEVWETIPA